MKKALPLFLSLLLGTSLFCSCEKDEKDPLATSAASTDPARGLAIHLADLGNATSSSDQCLLDLAKLKIIGKPLTEADIDYYDQGKGSFKLKVSQYDWLSNNLEAIQKARQNGYGYYAMTLTLDGDRLFGGVVLSYFSSLSCSSGQPTFWEDETYMAPKPGPNPRSEQSFILPVKKIVATNTTAEQQTPKLDAGILDRLEKIGKLKK